VSLSIEISAPGGRETRITLRGEVDYETAQDLRAAISGVLGRHGLRTIVVSLIGVTLLDSTGIGTLVVAQRICRDLGVALQVCDANPFIARLFAVVGVAETLGVQAPDGLAPTPTAGRLKAPASQPV
jgi:anti-sigma B factor antagonist